MTLMNYLKKAYARFEKIVSHVKFAVVIISLFTMALVYGTFVESYHGAGYANKLVYKSWWFIGIELAMFISIFMATVVRLPLKKRLYGFYVIHSGLMVLFIGSFFTYMNGIDGYIQLVPNSPSHQILIDEDILRISMPNKSYKMTLPKSHSKVKINQSINNVTILEYLPSTENTLEWSPLTKKNEKQHSSQYQLFNNNMSQDMTLTLSPKSDFKSMLRLGLLNIHYMPHVLQKCFTKDSESGFIVWHLLTGECFTAEEKNLPTDKTKTGNRFLIIKQKDNYLKFFPDYSPVAINDDLTKNPDTPYRVLSRNIFAEQPNLFLFGKEVVFYDKNLKKWTSKSFEIDNIISLPWMEFKLRLIKHSSSHYPIEIPQYTKPIQENGQIIKGAIKAVKIKYMNKTYYARSDGPLTISSGQDKLQFEISPKKLDLPYQITLERFKMNKNPGTNNPASFESFIQLLDGRDETAKIKHHHVYMNNPLKYDDFTFYQSSYFPIDNNQFGSVLSVNYDPGRFFKYLGSLLIVLGSIWHFIINRKKKVSHV